MHTFRTIMFAAVAACCLLRASASEEVATFSSLPKDDELHVTFTSRGCWQDASYQLTFRRSIETAVSVVQFKRERSPDLKVFTSTNSIDLGDLSLTKTDVEGLDRLLEFYRSSPPKGCTTIETISMSQYHAGKLVATEQFIDGSCSYDRKDLTRFTALIERLRKMK